MHTTYIEDRIASEHSFAHNIADVVGCMSREVHHVARQRAQRELFVVLEIHVEGVFQGSGLETIDGGECILHQRDALADTDGDVAIQLLFEILSGGEVIRMSVRLARHHFGKPVLHAQKDRRSQDSRYPELVLLDEGDQTIRRFGGNGAGVRVVIEHRVDQQGFGSLGVDHDVLPS